MSVANDGRRTDAQAQTDGADPVDSLQGVFVLPTVYPVTSTSLNYAPVAVGVVLVWSIVSWIFPWIGARYAHHSVLDRTVD